MEWAVTIATGLPMYHNCCHSKDNIPVDDGVVVSQRNECNRSGRQETVLFGELKSNIFNPPCSLTRECCFISYTNDRMPRRPKQTEACQRSEQRGCFGGEMLNAIFLFSVTGMAQNPPKFQSKRHNRERKILPGFSVDGEDVVGNSSICSFFVLYT